MQNHTNLSPDLTGRTFHRRFRIFSVGVGGVPLHDLPFLATWLPFYWRKFPLWRS